MSESDCKSRKRYWRVLPGIILAACLVGVSIPLARQLSDWVLALQGSDPSSSSGAVGPVSSVPVAILLGVLTRNLIPLPEIFLAGLRFCVGSVLRLGIIFVGIKLSLLDVFRMGAAGIPVVIVSITTGIVVLGWLSRRVNLPERLSVLIAAGTAICGVTAIAATAPTIEAEEQEVSCAVANITLFGMLGMLFYPYLAHALLDSPEKIGLFLGTAIHDTSQVVGAALTFRDVFHDEIAFKAATVTKLTRNLFLAVVVPLLAYRYARGKARVRQEGMRSLASRAEIFRLLPAFVLGFVGMALLRTVGDLTLGGGFAFGVWDAASWHEVTIQVGDVWGSQVCLATAMASVGLMTRLAVFRAWGWKPFAVGLAGALLVGAAGFAATLLFGPWVRL